MRADRAADAHRRAEALASSRRAESAQAAELLAGFVTRATEAGIEPRELKALGYGGRRRYRTGIVGWYLRRNCTIGVDTDGKYYVLKVPDSLTARFTKVQVPPSDPPLVVGAGGRDGEAIDLSALLAQRLATPTDWPTP